MELFYLDEVDSTNKYAKGHIQKFSDKTVIYTFNQTAGRGRLDRKWNYTGCDNIYASIILKPSDDMKDIYSNLTQYLCVVLAEIFEEYGVKPEIKWPNDIQINGKKISGILAEGVIERGKLEGLILGFGINLNTDKDILSRINQPATSLNLETGHFIDKDIFLKKLLNRFCLRYDEFIKEGFISIRKDYLERANFLNKKISVNVFNTVYTGIAEGVTDKGALKINDKNGEEKILFIGDIL